MSACKHNRYPIIRNRYAKRRKAITDKLKNPLKDNSASLTISSLARAGAVRVQEGIVYKFKHKNENVAKHMVSK
jgi:hypothetical protein